MVVANGGGLWWWPMVVAYGGGVWWWLMVLAYGGGLWWWPMVVELSRIASASGMLLSGGHVVGRVIYSNIITFLLYHS
jgi:hypothetical protein